MQSIIGSFVIITSPMPWYIISSNLVHRITINKGDLQLYNNEDVSVAVWLSPYKTERKLNIMSVSTYLYGASRGCSNKHLLTGKQNIADIRSKHQLLLHSAGK